MLYSILLELSEQKPGQLFDSTRYYFDRKLDNRKQSCRLFDYYIVVALIDSRQLQQMENNEDYSRPKKSIT